MLLCLVDTFLLRSILQDSGQRGIAIQIEMTQDMLDLVLTLHIADEELSGIVDDGIRKIAPVLQDDQHITQLRSCDQIVVHQYGHTTRDCRIQFCLIEQHRLRLSFVHTQEHVRDLIDLSQDEGEDPMFQIPGIIVIGERIFGIHRHLRERDQIEGAIETEHLRDIGIIVPEEQAGHRIIVQGIQAAC